MELNANLPHGDHTTFYPPRLRLLVLVGVCVLFGTAFLVMSGADALPLAVIGWIGLTLMTVSGIVLLLRALRPGPTVVIDEIGIIDRTTLAGPGRVRWDEITVIRKKEIGRGRSAERLLEIVLTDPEEFHSRPRNVVRRTIEWYRGLMKQPLLSIPGSMVSAPIQEVMDTIRQRRPDLQVLEGPPPPPPRFRFSRRPPSKRKHPDLPNW